MKTKWLDAEKSYGAYKIPLGKTRWWKHGHTMLQTQTYAFPTRKYTFSRKMRVTWLWEPSLWVYMMSMVQSGCWLPIKIQVTSQSCLVCHLTNSPSAEWFFLSVHDEVNKNLKESYKELLFLYPRYGHSNMKWFQSQMMYQRYNSDYG